MIHDPISLEVSHAIDARPVEPNIQGRVLLVDDDTATRHAYSRLLGRLGCVVETAASGQAALDILRTASFDLIVSDVNMPGISGTALLRAVRDQHLDVPVILITGAGGPEIAADAVGYGPFRYLTKPFDFDTLALAVRTAIYSHAVTQVLTERVPLLEACRRIVRATCQGFDWDFSAIWRPSDDGERMHCAETWARPGYDATAFENATTLAEIEVGRGLPGRVWACGSPEWIPNISADSNFPRAPFAVAAGFQSGFAVPVGAEGEVFAVIEFFSHRRRGPDLVLLELFATSSARLGAQVLRQRADQRAQRAETAERAVTSALNAIMECAPAFIIAVDEAGKIRFINRVLAHHKKEEVIGSDWLQYMPPADHDRHRAHLRQVLATGVPDTYETTVLGPEGRTLSFTTHIGPLRDNARVVGAVLVAQEVTELKRIQAEFAAAQQLAAVGTMAAGVAHEINTPVQFVSDSVHFLRDASRDMFGLVDKLQVVRRLAADVAPAPALQEASDAAMEEEVVTDLGYLRENVPSAFQRCLDGIDRISTIVRSMKEFAHPAQQQMAAVDLNRAIQSTLTIARTEYKYVAELEVDLGELPPVVCHVNDINQVVLNLVVNAAHAIGDVVTGSDRKGTIKVRTRRDGEHVVISISDTGTGIPAAIAKRVFEPFFTTKAVGKGTGQGLALAWTVVTERHGGELTFDSKQGEGTTFSVRLPIAGKQINQSQVLPSGPPQSSDSRESRMLVSPS